MRWLAVIAVGLALCTVVSNGQIKGTSTPKPPPNGNEAAKPKTVRTEKSELKETQSKPEAQADEKKAAVKPEIQAAVDGITKQVGSLALKPARILVVLPMPFYSHTQNYIPIFKELARRGHNITMISPYPQKEPLANWEDIVTENVIEKMYAKMPTKDMTEMNHSFLGKVLGIIMFAGIVVELLGEMQPVKDVYNDDSREFDLVIIESQFIQEPLLAFGWKFKAPVISLYPSYIVPEVAYYTGNPVFTTNYVPNMGFDTTNEMNLYERFQNTAYAVCKLLVYNLYYLPMMDKTMREFYPAPELPYVADILFNVSFTLLDSNPVLVYPYPRANNMREFLGINTKPAAPLSPELQKIMDGAGKEGVLLFTLGSHFPPSSLKPYKLEAILYAFSKIPQQVIMKWDKDEPPSANLPPNVHIFKWVPQAGILRHKNCKAFFTHTGVHGVMEAMDHGVPVISFPLFADQDFFATWVEKNGVGMKLDHKTITPQIALATVKEVLENPKYKENAVGVSIKLKDVPQPTLDEIVYWVEHVLRTKGAAHLRPGSLSLWWFQRFGLDVLAIFIAIIILPIWIISVVIRCLCTKCRGKTRSTKSENKRQKEKKEN